MSKINIIDLEVFFHVGVPDEERTRPQRLLLTVEMDHDFNAAVAADSISGTIDYFKVAERLRGLGEGRSWKLIETLASEVADLVLKEFKPNAVIVEVKKFPIPQARHVAVRVNRQRD
jgi:dihydroneopterin aldolase